MGVVVERRNTDNYLPFELGETFEEDMGCGLERKRIRLPDTAVKGANRRV